MPVDAYACVCLSVGTCVCVRTCVRKHNVNACASKENAQEVTTLLSSAQLVT